MGTARRPIRVLLADDSLAMLWGLGKLVEGEAPNMALVGQARHAEEALSCARLHLDVIVLNLTLGGASSVELIPALRAYSGGRVLIHTGIGDRRLHEDAMLFGAAGVIAADAPAARVLAAIECVHAGGYWNLDPSVVSPRRADRELASAARSGIDFLSPVERRTIARLYSGCNDAPLAIADLVSIYNKLGLRNRRELDRLARLGAHFDD